VEAETEIGDANVSIQRHRLVKSPAERELMRLAGRATGEAFVEVCIALFFHRFFSGLRPRTLWAKGVPHDPFRCH
jgi:Xaa-Pro aminopeptidase